MEKAMKFLLILNDFILLILVSNLGHGSSATAWPDLPIDCPKGKPMDSRGQT